MFIRKASHWIEGTLGISPPFQGKVFASIAIIILLWLMRELFLKIVLKRKTDPRVRYQWHKFSTYIASILGAVLIGREWFEGFETISTFLGLFSAGLAISLKDPLMNIAGWVFMMWSRPYNVGDRIQIGAFSGDVIDQQLFQITLLEIGNWVNADQSTGRVIHIPNGKLFTEPLANYSQGLPFIWDEIPVTLTLKSDWRKAKEFLKDIACRHSDAASKTATQELKDLSGKYLIYYNKLSPAVYTSVTERGVVLAIRYLCEPRKRRDMRQTIWEEILREFASHADIEIAVNPVK